MKRAGFTMIELIFVIVILGILAAVAVPKLAATRNDAKVSADLTSAAQALSNLGAEYTAQGTFTNYDIDDANNAVKCFTFAYQNGSGGDGNVTVQVGGSNTTTEKCPEAVATQVGQLAGENGVTGASGASKVHSFGGTGVKR